MAASTKWAWSLSHPINPELGVTLRERALAGFAIVAALALHAALIWLLFGQIVVAVRAPAPLAVTLVRLPPPPVAAPKPKPVPKPVLARPRPVAKTVVRTLPRPRAQLPSPTHRATTQITHPGPPVLHFGAAGDDAGLGLDLGTPAGGSGHGSLAGFDDAVKQRIQAAKTYPPGIPGMWNECVVSYSVTIDRAGNLVNYQLFGCGDAFLDAAARAAILLAAPFPPPPDFGGSTYEVFGSLVFKK